MKIIKKLCACFVIASLLTVILGSFAGCGSSGKVKLYFDGGGGSGNYNTTTSYNTLEKLAKEWNSKNDKYEIVINTASLNGNRGSVTSMLSAGKAPDLLMQVGGVINDDIGNNWYADLTPYLSLPNPYEEGNTAWKDIYGDGAIAASRASDGKNYYVCLDQVAVGVLYNMDILNAAGVTKVPETHSEFVACLEALQAAKNNGTITAEVYMHGGLWHETYIGTSVYGSKIPELDLDGSNTLSTYELIKSYKEGKWNLSDEYFREFLRLCYQKAQYYPTNYLSYDTLYNFARGRLAITDALGNQMRTLTRNAKFKTAIAGYPVLDEEASKFGGYKSIRGSAGLSSAYWVTNSAVNKGQEAVDACVDFLMFLTASDNNARLVNDLGYALPLNVDNSTVDLFEGLKEQYKADQRDGGLMWGACYMPDMLGTDFNSYYQLAMGDFYEDSKGNKTGDADAVITDLNSHIDGCLNDIISKFNWTL